MVRMMDEKYHEQVLKLVRENPALTQTYHQAVAIAQGELSKYDAEINDELKSFLEVVDDKDVKQVMGRFVELVRNRLRILNVEVLSAIELQRSQIRRLEENIVRYSSRQVVIHNTVDPEIIGGLRIIIGDTVIDNSIKTQLNEIREELYKGVYFKSEINPE